MESKNYKVLLICVRHDWYLLKHFRNHQNYLACPPDPVAEPLPILRRANGEENRIGIIVSVRRLAALHDPIGRTFTKITGRSRMSPQHGEKRYRWRSNTEQYAASCQRWSRKEGSQRDCRPSRRNASDGYQIPQQISDHPIRCFALLQFRAERIVMCGERGRFRGQNANWRFSR